jgi:hypothetical protein
LTTKLRASKRTPFYRGRFLETILPVAALLAAAVPWSADDFAAADPVVTTAEYTVSAGNNDSHVLPAAYSTGRGGRQLKWLPTRGRSASQTGGSPSRVQAARHDVPSPVKVAARGTVDPFSNPFGKSVSVPVSGQSSPDKAVNDDLLKGQATPLMLPRPSLEIPGGAGLLDAESSQQSERITGPSVTDEMLAVGPAKPMYECPSPDDIPPLSKVNLSIAPPKPLPVPCTLETGDFEERAWAPTTFMWKASGLCHKPAYFEQLQLERYGHSTGPYTQPLASAAHFFLTVPVLPYKMGLYPPGECIYTLGYYRPGSCAPYMLDPLPLSIRAGVAQAGVMTGLAAIIP